MLDDTRLFNLVHLKKKYTYQYYDLSPSNGLT